MFSCSHYLLNILNGLTLSLLSVTRVATETTSWSKLSKLVSYHILCNINRDKFVTVMNCNSMSYEIRRYH